MPKKQQKRKPIQDSIVVSSPAAMQPYVTHNKQTHWLRNREQCLYVVAASLDYGKPFR